ncbi:MAG: OmpA family protein [Myxococcales bacterium]|nr:OmpA family protein [Myxococcales bacterium]
MSESPPQSSPLESAASAAAGVGLTKEGVAAPSDGIEATGSDDAYGTLRELLLAPEQRELSDLKRQLLQVRAPVAVDSVAEVLPAAVALANEHSPQMAAALQPLLEGTLTHAVRQRPEVIAEAIFPIMGPAISRAIREALSRMMQQTTYALEHAFSLRSWRWRLEARATGKPFSEVVLLHSLVYRVEQVFLIHPESGLPLQHVHVDLQHAAASESVELQNASMVSSMLTAIQDFVRDSFRVDSKAALDTVEVGDVTVWIERGPHAVLAGVIRGTAPVSLRAVFREVLGLCHRDFLPQLKAFSGDSDELQGVRPHLVRCLQQQQQEKSRRPIKALLILSLLFIAALAGLGYLGVQSYQSAQTLRRATASLQQQLGVVVVQARRSGGRFDIEILRDPQAKPVEILLREAGLSPDRATLHERPFLAMQPELIVGRAALALRPPSSVQLSMPSPGTLQLVGQADEDWIDDARFLVGAIAGVQSVDFDVKPLPKPPQLYDILMERARALEAIVFHFRAGSIELVPGQEAQQSKALAEIKEILRMAQHDDSLDVTIEVYAHTDTIGDELYNLRLRESRAKQMRVWLANAGIDMRKLRAVAPLQFEQERAERAASFRVVVTARTVAKKRSR